MSRSSVGGFLAEFKKFAARGNALDLAVGIIIGAAFTTVVSSIVKDLIMPPLGLLLGGVDMTNLFLTLKGGSFDTLEAAKAAGAVTINYGVFLNAVLNFLIVAFAVFVLVRQMNRLLAPPPPESPAAPPPTHEEVLLTEIRDAIRANAS